MDLLKYVSVSEEEIYEVKKFNNKLEKIKLNLDNQEKNLFDNFVTDNILKALADGVFSTGAKQK